MGRPPDFSNEPDPSDSKKRKRVVCVLPEDQCAVCEEVQRDPVSLSCGHWFCRQCIRPYWDQPGPTGDYACPRCGTRSTTRPGLQTHSQTITEPRDGNQQEVLDHRTSLKVSFECVTESTAKAGNGTPLNKIYTALYIIEGQSEEVNTQHEVWQLETVSKMKTFHDTPIDCRDLFKPLPGTKTHVRVVLTLGIAGIGKTFSVQKFTLDWAERSANRDVDLLILLSFRELNFIKDKQYSLLTLIHVFHPTLKMVTAEKLARWKVVFIFDGLDESRLPLDFQHNETVSDVTQTASVDVLLTNLISGDLLPSAFLWITSRPAASNQIPPQCVDRVTEVQGFNDPQKEEFFRRRFGDEDLARRIISNIKGSRSLYIMCRIPVFCWMAAKVLEHMTGANEEGEMPKTLTEMYAHFLLVQTKRKRQKYDLRHGVNQQELVETDREYILKLGRLAFEHLEKGNLMFYQEDLEECGLDFKEVLCSGMCKKIFKEEFVLFQRRVYSFVHLSIQEFLAAVYVFHCYTTKKMDVLKYFLKKTSKAPLTLHGFLKGTLDKSLESKNGHLDLFVRFLHGLSLESNQRLLGGLLALTRSSPECIEKIIRSLKVMRRKKISPERCINTFHCLMEMNDSSLHREIREYLNSPEDRPEKSLSLGHCSALAYILQASDEVLDVFDLKSYRTSSLEGHMRLIPAVRNCKEARLAGCKLTSAAYEVLTSALSSNPSHLRELDLSNNHLADRCVELVSVGLRSPHCRLEILRLSGCLVTEEGCASLGSALNSNPSHLRELDLSCNHPHYPGHSGVRRLSAGLGDPHWRLETLDLDHGGEHRIPHLLTKYACELTLDPNTAHKRLSLSEDERKVTRGGEDQPYPDHPERFDHWQHVLCREGLTGRRYWELEWSGKAYLGLAYGGIGRKGVGEDCRLGFNAKSWCLNCYRDSYTAWHNGEHVDILVPSSGSSRVGVYVDWPAGTLSFYRVSDTRRHLHTFHCSFTEALYPGFGFWLSGSVSLCQLPKAVV